MLNYCKWHLNNHYFANYREPIVLRQPLETDSNEPITDQDNELLAKFREYRYGPEKMTWDPNCYECKVRYRDPKAKDLVMYLHAWRYKVIIAPETYFQGIFCETISIILHFSNKLLLLF